MTFLRMSMNNTQFQRFCEIALQKAGLSLKAGKEALVEARVAKRLRALGIGTAQEYLEYLEQEPTGEEIVQFLDTISTNFTSFMREADHFDFLGSLAKEWLRSGRKRVRIWCAASSTGQEPYGIGMTLAEVFAGGEVDFRILATDISTKVLAHAEAGCYTQRELQALPRYLRARYFGRDSGWVSSAPIFRVAPKLRQHIVFKRLNLAELPYPMQGPFDAVFCRNVMIYFDHKTRVGLVSEVERLLRPGGFLITGHAETLTGIARVLKLIQPTIYERQAADRTECQSESRDGGARTPTCKR